MKKSEPGADGRMIKFGDSGSKKANWLDGLSFRGHANRLAHDTAAAPLGCTWHAAKRGGGLECTWDTLRRR